MGTSNNSTPGEREHQKVLQSFRNDTDINCLLQNGFEDEAQDEDGKKAFEHFRTLRNDLLKQYLNKVEKNQTFEAIVRIVGAISF